jgi:proteic killer suppression protein
MICSFRARDVERLFDDRDVPRFRSFERVARRKLLLLHRAVSLQDLGVPPGNRRICFVWRDGDAFDVEIADYH